ncbi:MAG: T9SS type A sorting domain-containing protein, partial [bacterium]|nr:T9SS type A sorting domain-containing protein [bacterium]
GDLVPDGCDACPGFDDTEDADFDGIPDSCDNCILAQNFGQSDSDGDGVGDACDLCPGSDDTIDSDFDSIADGCDECPGYDDLIDDDTDDVPDSCDNCPTVANPDQLDSNGNGYGDKCEYLSVPGEYVRNPSGLPDQFGLAQNYPNPFNSETIIRYAVPFPSPVKLTIYNLLGQKVVALVDGPGLPGYFEAHWDGKNRRGQDVPTGVYLYRLETVQGAYSKKMVYLK